MAKGYVQKQASPIIMLNSKMDSRSNQEYIDISDESGHALTFVNLENADLFNSKALSTRLGSIDLGNGIINASGAPALWYSYPSGLSGVFNSGTTGFPVFMSNLFWDREGMIILVGDTGGHSPISNFNIEDWKVYLKDTSTSGSALYAPETGYDITVQAYLTEIQNNGVIVGNIEFYDQFGNVHDINKNDNNFNASGTAPQIINPPTYAPIPNIVDGVPVAISEPTIVNFGTVYASGQGIGGDSYGTPWKQVNLQFSAPYPITYGAYYLKLVVNNTSGTSSRGLFTQVSYTDIGQTLQPFNSGRYNTVYANEYLNYPNDGVLRLSEGAYPVSGVTGWMTGEIDAHTKASTVLKEYPAVSSTWPVPVASGETYSGEVFQWGVALIPGNTFKTYPVGTAPSTIPGMDTASAEFGNLITLPSGVHTINGGYIYAQTYSGNGYTTYDSAGNLLNTNGYSVNYVANFYQVLNTTAPYQTKLLASYDGSYTFNNQNTYKDTVNDPTLGGVNVDLAKIYSVFPNPAVVTTSGTTQYLLTYQFLDNITNNPSTDFGVSTIFGYPNSYYYKFISPIKVGTTTPVGSDLFVVSSSGQGFVPYGAGANYSTLSCGLLSFASGNGILGIYDYTIGSSRSKKVIYEQQNNMYAAEYGFIPTTSEIIFSGGTGGNNDLKWNHLTYQNLLFATQYSQSGTQVCWDQIYTQASGNYTQPWGLQPQWSMIPVSGVPVGLNTPVGSGAVYSGESLGYGLMSGTTVTVLLGTQMESGGIRASQQDFTAPFDNCYIQLSGTDIFRISGTDANSQYKFDVLPQGTYVFTTAPSKFLSYSGTAGAATQITETNQITDIFFLAEILSQPSGLSAECINPLTNSGTFAGAFLDVSGIAYPNPYGKIYLGNFDTTTLTQQIPAITNYNQSYLNEQVPTPPGKKMVTFFDYTIMVGDPNYPSRMWYTGQLQPQVWGTDGNVAGYIEVSPDDGSPITDIAVFRDNLYVFKYNSIYRYTYTQNPNTPFYKYTMSTTLGSLGFFNSISTDYGVIFLSQFGPALINLGSPDTIGDEIFNYYQTLDHTNLTFAVGIYDRARQQVYFSISQNPESAFNETGLCYSLAEKAWNIRQGGMWNAAGIVGDFDNFNQLYIGTSNGQLQQISEGNSDSDVVFVDGQNGATLTSSISLYGETPWLSMGDSMNLKNLRNIRINCDNSKQTLRVDVYYDQDDTNIQYTRYINMDAAVIQRTTALGGRPCRTVKFVFTTVGEADAVQIRSMQFTYQDLGKRTNI